MNIGITAGDTNGIGIEIFYKSLPIFSQSHFFDEHSIGFIGSERTLEEYLSKCGLDNRLESAVPTGGALRVEICDTGIYSPVEFGKESKFSGAGAIAALNKSVECLRSGAIDVVVTLPISKKVNASAGWTYPGHTEFYAANFTPSSPPLMMLYCDMMKVALATIHIPVGEIVSKLRPKELLRRMEIFSESLRCDFGIDHPKIAVLGLNPHAGEDGKMGTEETEIISPTICTFNSREGIATGPFSSDAFFAHEMYKEFDGVMAMYHDQGLIPLKMMSRKGGVNFTAGLPIVRTSPDHGTAFDIAGRNIADPSALIYAIREAVKIAASRKDRIPNN